MSKLRLQKERHYFIQLLLWSKLQPQTTKDNFMSLKDSWEGIPASSTLPSAEDGPPSPTVPSSTWQSTCSWKVASVLPFTWPTDDLSPRRTRHIPQFLQVPSPFHLWVHVSNPLVTTWLSWIRIQNWDLSYTAVLFRKSNCLLLDCRLPQKALWTLLRLWTLWAPLGFDFWLPHPPQGHGKVGGCLLEIGVLVTSSKKARILLETSHSWF